MTGKQDKTKRFNCKVFDDWERALPFIDLPKYHHYIRSYPELLKASKCLANEFKEKSVPMIAHLAYGWMPTILKYSWEIEQDSKIYEAVSAKTTTDGLNVVESIEHSPTNNAWVGMSKTLHFLNPEIFPILDSNVAKVLGVFSSGNEKDTYKDYMDFVFSKMNESFVNEFRDGFYKKAGYKISKVRAVEFILFAIEKTNAPQGS